MKFHKLKIAVLEYLRYHQKENCIGIDVLQNEFKKSSLEDIDIACKRLIEEGLACRHASVIAGFENLKSAYRIRITKAGIDFLIDIETSEASKENNKINRKMLYVTVASVMVAIAATIVTYICGFK